MAGVWLSYLSSNRTIVGLKPEVSRYRESHQPCSNRTIVGLKLGLAGNHLLTEVGSNRTIVGLKHELSPLRIRGDEAAIAPLWD